MHDQVRATIHPVISPSLGGRRDYEQKIPILKGLERSLMALGQELGLVLPTFAHAAVAKPLVSMERVPQPAEFARGWKGGGRRGNCV